MHRFLSYLSLIFLLTFSTLSNAQERSRIELLGAKSLRFDKSLGIDAQRLIGDVRFSHEGAIMYCDSAYLYNKSNSLDAFGNVRITQGDTLTLTSDRLFYDGNSQTIRVRDNVTLADNEMTLETHTLDYFRKSKQAIFYDRGRIESKVNDNTLLACEGVYDSGIEFFYFRDSVILKNPDYVVETDTLHYANNTEIAYFFGPTFIFSDENTIYCENGWYDTRKDVSQFNENAYIDNKKQVLKGDSLWYSRNEELGKAFRNVSVIDTASQYIINGEYGEYDDLRGRNFVTGKAEMIQYDQRDSLFLHGDTLLAVRDSILGDRVFAYNHVKFFRNDIQGAADSLVFAPNDSLIRMYHEPVLWSDSLQITGDTIYIRTYDGIIENLFVFDHAFMANKVDSVKFNQIKGKKLTGYFRDNDLYRVMIRGNGESLYYAVEEEKEPEIETPIDTLKTEESPKLTPKRKYIGVNKAICSNIEIFLKNRQVNRILFLNKPDGTFYPLSQFPKEERYFDGFEWEGLRRPLKRSDIFENTDAS